MTHAIRIAAQGDSSVLGFESVEVGAPGPTEAVVRHTVIGVNFIDIYQRSGLYPLPSLPSGLGIEAAGIIEEVGANVSELRSGDRVAYAGGLPGAYAERRVVAADRLVKLPDDISDEVAAASMLKGMTVEYLIRRTYPVTRGQTVLWHAAAGGVGLIACQWLRSLGVRVVGTVGSAAKAELAHANGCAETILYRHEDFVERVRAITSGKGVPVVYDSVGKSTFLRSLDCLEPRGMLVEFGNASGKPEPLDVNLLSAKGSLFLTRPTLFSYTATRDELLASAEALFEVIRRGAVKSHVSARFALRDAGAAHRSLEARETTGSIVLLP
jgi:NADPH:quinone reductase